MAAHPDPELWATLPDAERLLSNILADPRGDHVEAVQKQSIGILCDAHVAGIVRALEGLSAGAVFPKSFTRDAGAALHTVLYHLLGGADLNLPAPPRESTREETRRCSPGWSVARPAKAAFFKALAKAKASARKDGGVALRELQGRPFAPASHKNLRPFDAGKTVPGKQAAAATAKHAADAAPAPDPADPAEAEIRRRAACCLALAVCCMPLHGLGTVLCVSRLWQLPSTVH